MGEPSHYNLLFACGCLQVMKHGSLNSLHYAQCLLLCSVLNPKLVPRKVFQCLYAAVNCKYQVSFKRLIAVEWQSTCCLVNSTVKQYFQISFFYFSYSMYEIQAVCKFD